MNPIRLSRADQLDPYLDDDRVVIGFFGEFSPVSVLALPSFLTFAEQTDDATVVLVDVVEVRGLHKRYDVTSVPAAVTLSGGKVIRRASGLHDADGWRRALLPHAFTDAAREGAPPKPVTVYTSPTCVWCDRVKAWLDAQSVAYREINVAADPQAAQELVRRSGQMGVPQIDVGGQMVVGFDKPRLNLLLGLNAA